MVEFYESWKYRDWVVAAFNADLPYDQFLHAQICGDSYPPMEDGTPNYDGLVATTWMQLGPWDNGDADKHKIVADIVDDQINVIGQSMLAMTLACARCHDHKFDPVTIEDYYGLAGMFYSSRVLEKLGAKGAHTELLRTPVAPPEYVRRRAEQLQVIAEVERNPSHPNESRVWRNCVPNCCPSLRWSWRFAKVAPLAACSTEFRMYPSIVAANTANWGRSCRGGCRNYWRAIWPNRSSWEAAARCWPSGSPRRTIR